MEQRSEEWFLARAGSVGASQLSDVMAKGRGGAVSATRRNLLARMVAERMTGRPTDSGYINGAMQRGIDLEPQARAAYEWSRGVEVVEVGLIPHPDIKHTHASPDGLVGDDGMVEIKCPNTATHIDTLLGASIDSGYAMQMQWQMRCAGRQWVDFVSYDDRMPEDMQIVIIRVPRDDAMIEQLEAAVIVFQAEVEAMIASLREAAVGRE